MGIRESIQLLQLTSTAFAGKTSRHASHFDNVSFPQLTQLLERMNSVSVARKVFCPEEYFRYWFDFKNNVISEIPSRVRRFLCWAPTIGTEFAFLTYLTKLNEPLSANSLQGLVYA